MILNMKRYRKQILLDGIGLEGQKRLLRARVGIVGLGALGSALLEILVRAGVGFIRAIDRDIVELDNLQRQHLFTTRHAEEGVPKAIAAAEAARAINPEVTVEPQVADLVPENAETLLSGLDLIADGTDNLETRFLINDFAVKHGIPWVYTAAVGESGMIMPILPGQGPCLRCLLPGKPDPGRLETCDIAGVLGSTTTLMAALEAHFILKFLAGETPTPVGWTLRAELADFDFRRYRVSRRPDCPACGLRRFEFLEEKAFSSVLTLCGRDAYQVRPSKAGELDLKALSDRLRALGQVHLTPYTLRFRTDGTEILVFRDGRALIRKPGLTREEARSLYSRLIGL